LALISLSISIAFFTINAKIGSVRKDRIRRRKIRKVKVSMDITSKCKILTSLPKVGRNKFGLVVEPKKRLSNLNWK
jgi:hypothetical protein